MTDSPQHECPAPGCTAMVAQSQFACRPHWYALPKDIRDRIWAGYRNGDTEAHRRAMADGIDYLQARYGPARA